MKFSCFDKIRLCYGVLLATIFVAMAGTASAQMTNWVHITMNDNSVVHFSQTELQSMIIDTKDPACVEFTYNNKTVKVAKMNLGATTIAESPETCCGDYYGWGLIEPSCTVDYSTNPATVTAVDGHTGGYSDVSYPYWNGNEYTKYTSSDKKTVLEDGDDVVKVIMPGWHMPTKEEFDVLLEACNYSNWGPDVASSSSSYSRGVYWVAGATSPVTIGDDTYKVNGMLFVQDADTHVFFPSGGRIGGTQRLYTRDGVYWTSSLNKNTYRYAYNIGFSDQYIDCDDAYARCVGMLIRPFKD